MPGEICILVADDHPVVRDGLVAILETQPDFVVVGEAANGVEVLQQVETAAPDVVLLDLEMPKMDGLETLQRLREQHPGIRVIVFTAFDTDERIIGALQAGAQGYLLKGAPRSDVFKAIRVVSEGGSLLEPVVASRLLQHISTQEEQPPAMPEPLTEREEEVLQLLARGKTNREIAQELYITERTVKFHVSSILGKLGAGNRTEAVSIAAQQGLVDLG